MNTQIADHTEQPNKYTCQSAAIAKVLGKTSHHDVMDIRQSLLSKAQPRGTMSGDPYVMGHYLESRVEEYRYLNEGSLNDLMEWVERGPDHEAIVHGFPTTAGHVWGVEKLVTRPNGYRYFQCDDPWYEYDFPNARYTNKSGANVLYSEIGMWAYCVRSWSKAQAMEAYREGISRYFESGFVDSIMAEKGGWIHLIRN